MSQPDKRQEAKVSSVVSARSGLQDDMEAVMSYCKMAEQKMAFMKAKEKKRKKCEDADETGDAASVASGCRRDAEERGKDATTMASLRGADSGRAVNFREPDDDAELPLWHRLRRYLRDSVERSPLGSSTHAGKQLQKKHCPAEVRTRTRGPRSVEQTRSGHSKRRVTSSAAARKGKDVVLRRRRHKNQELRRKVDASCETRDGGRRRSESVQPAPERAEVRGARSQEDFPGHCGDGGHLDAESMRGGSGEGTGARASKVPGAPSATTGLRRAAKPRKSTISVVAKKSRHAMTCFCKRASSNAAQQFLRPATRRGSDLVEIYRNLKFKDNMSDFVDGGRAARQKRKRGNVAIVGRPGVRLAATRTEKPTMTFSRLRSQALDIGAFSKGRLGGIPFVAGMSTSPTHNIKLTLQQVLSVIKMKPVLRRSRDLGRPPAAATGSLAGRRGARRSPMSRWSLPRKSGARCSEESSGASGVTAATGTTWPGTPRRPEDVWVVDQDVEDRRGRPAHKRPVPSHGGLVGYHEVLARYVDCFEGALDGPEDMAGKVLRQDPARPRERFRQEGPPEQMSGVVDRRRLPLLELVCPSGSLEPSLRRARLLRSIQSLQHHLRQIT